MTISELIEKSKEAKLSHEKWREVQLKLQKEGKELIPHVGNPEWHQQWIEYYDKILIILKINNINF